MAAVAIVFTERRCHCRRSADANMDISPGSGDKLGKLTGIPMGRCPCAADSRYEHDSTHPARVSAEAIERLDRLATLRQISEIVHKTPGNAL